MTAQDALALRGVMASVMSGTYRSSMFSRQVEGVDEHELWAIAVEDGLLPDPETPAVGCFAWTRRSTQCGSPIRLGLLS
jgi:hypothetical protein